MELTLLGAALAAAIPIGLVTRFVPLPGAREDLGDLVLGSVMVGLLVGRLAAMIGNGVNPITNPMDIIIVRSGVATGWATLAALMWLSWTTRPAWRLALDQAAPAGLIGLAGWHAGCVVRDACLGTPSDMQWALALDGSAVTRHPVEIYAMEALLVGAVLIWVYAGRSQMLGTGRFAGLALAGAGAVRLATEPLRPALGSGPIIWYGTAIVVGVGVAIASRRSRTADEAA
jgi:prolipoprotein diacylglyceryltransferase